MKARSHSYGGDDMTRPPRTDEEAIAALRLALQTRSPEEFEAAFMAGDEETVDLVCQALPAIRRKAGLTIAEFMGRDLAAEFGLAYPVEH